MVSSRGVEPLVLSFRALMPLPLLGHPSVSRSRECVCWFDRVRCAGWAQVFKFLEALEASEDVDVVFHDAA